MGYVNTEATPYDGENTGPAQAPLRTTLKIRSSPPARPGHRPDARCVVRDGGRSLWCAASPVALEYRTQNPVRPATAVAHIAGQWPAVLTQMIGTIDLAHDRRIALVDVALAHTNSDVDYEPTDAVRTYLQDVYTSLPTLAEPQTRTDSATENAGSPAATPGDDQVRNAVTTMTRAGFVCDDLAALNPTALRLVVTSDCYTLTSANLRTALGDPATLSLDHIRAADADVYADVLEHPDKYLTAIANDIAAATETDTELAPDPEDRPGIGARRVASDDNTEPRSRTRWTVENPDAFEAIVIDLADYSTQQAADVLSRAHPDCIINHLSAVPDTTWEALARCDRFPANLDNIDGYIKHLGALDADLAAILTAAGTITVPDDDEDTASADDPADDAISDTKIRVAEAILRAADVIPDPTTRVNLVTSLDLEKWFPVTSVRAEPGPLLGLLIGERVCADEPALFEHFGTSDWDTLRYAINRSTKFIDFVTPTLLDAEMTSRLLDSTDIRADVKQAVLERFNEFVPPDHRRAQTAAGRAALATNTRLGAGRITSIATGSGDTDLVVQLLHRFEGDLSTDQALDALSKLPAPYNELARSGAKLTFPKDPHHTAVLNRFKADGRITTRALPKSRTKEARIEVTVP